MDPITTLATVSGVKAIRKPFVKARKKRNRAIREVEAGERRRELERELAPQKAKAAESKRRLRARGFGSSLLSSFAQSSTGLKQRFGE